MLYRYYYSKTGSDGDGIELEHTMWTTGEPVVEPETP